MQKESFSKSLIRIALPISIQSLFQASLSIIDQLMVGGLGEVETSAVGFGGKFYGIFIYTILSISVTASVMISQYVGSKDKKNVSNSFNLTMIIGLIVASLFTIISLTLSTPIIDIYTNDASVVPIGASYLRIVSIGFLPFVITNMLCSLYRNTNHVNITVIGGICSVILNTGLNYIFIYLLGMRTDGAAYATTIVRYFECFLILMFFIYYQKRDEYKITPLKLQDGFLKRTLKILVPLFFTELLWSIGESVYAIIYGHIGTFESAAMMDISPIIGITIGFFSGFSQAAGILVGQKLGANEFEGAYKTAWKIIKIGIIGSIILGVLVVLLSGLYSNLYNVTDETRRNIVYLLIVYAFVLWTKVTNMIAGKIISSGGETKINLVINIIGTWAIGIPLGFLFAFAFHLPIYIVYLAISFEELFRNILCFIFLKKKKWMKNISISNA